MRTPDITTAFASDAEKTQAIHDAMSDLLRSFAALGVDDDQLANGMLAAACTAWSARRGPENIAGYLRTAAEAYEATYHTMGATPGRH